MPCTCALITSKTKASCSSEVPAGQGTDAMNVEGGVKRALLKVVSKDENDSESVILSHSLS